MLTYYWHAKAKSTVEWSTLDGDGWSKGIPLDCSGRPVIEALSNGSQAERPAGEGGVGRSVDAVPSAARNGDLVGLLRELLLVVRSRDAIVPSLPVMRKWRT